MNIPDFSPSMRLTYSGDLRSSINHLPSGTTIITDAPTDNYGKGESFSPTDLLCASLASCMVTLMGISAASKGIELGTISADIEKQMTSGPRRVAGIRLLIHVQVVQLDDRKRDILVHAAETCPVLLSIHPDIAITNEWVFDSK